MTAKKSAEHHFKINIKTMKKITILILFIFITCSAILNLFNTRLFYMEQIHHDMMAYVLGFSTIFLFFGWSYKLASKLFTKKII